jgi:hypothetical protein
MSLWVPNSEGKAYISPESIRQYNLEQAVKLVAKNYCMSTEAVDEVLRGACRGVGTPGDHVTTSTKLRQDTEKQREWNRIVRSCLDMFYRHLLAEHGLPEDPPEGYIAPGLPVGVGQDSWAMFRELVNEIIVEWREYRTGARVPEGAVPVEIALDPSRGVYVVLADLASDENAQVREGRAYIVYRATEQGGEA